MEEDMMDQNAAEKDAWEQKQKDKIHNAAIDAVLEIVNEMPVTRFHIPCSLGLYDNFIPDSVKEEIESLKAGEK